MEGTSMYSDLLIRRAVEVERNWWISAVVKLYSESAEFYEYAEKKRVEHSVQELNGRYFYV